MNKVQLDFFDKNFLHFNSKLQPFQFLFRINYSYDSYILAMHYNLFLTYYVFFLNFGIGVKTRFCFPFYKFHRWFPSKIHTNKLMFWLNFKYLVFDSYFPVVFKIRLKKKLNFVGYFPFSFYFSVFDPLYGFFDRFSFMANHVNEFRFKFFRRRYEFFFDLDLHISLYLGRGNKRLKVVGVINFFRYMIQEYFFIQGLEQSVVSLVKPHNEPLKMVATFSFFKKRVLFDFFFKLKKNFISNLFLFFSFNIFFFKNFVFFFFKTFLNFFFKFLKIYFFFKFVNFFFSNFKSFFFLNHYFKFFFFFRFFFFEFFFRFVLKKNKPITNINILIKFFNFFFKSFFFKFLNYNFFILNFLTIKNNIKTISFLTRFSFNNVLFLKFKVFKLLRRRNPFNSVRYSGLFKFIGFGNSFFKRNKFLYFRKLPSFVFFSFLIFLRFFYFLFLYIYKLNFIGSFGFYNYYFVRIYFFKLFYFSIFWYNRFLYKKSLSLV